MKINQFGEIGQFDSMVALDWSFSGIGYFSLIEANRP